MKSILCALLFIEKWADALKNVGLPFVRQCRSMSSWLAWISICRPSWPQTHKDPPASASQVLWLKAYTTTAQPG